MKAIWLAPAGIAIAPFAQVAHAVQYLSVEQAQRAAFPEATGFVPAALPSGNEGAAAPRFWRVEPSGALFAVDQVIGKSELITYAVAIDVAGAVRSVEILDYRESHGGEVRLAPWRRQFVGKTAADPIELNRDVRNISGATLSCRHVTEGVQRIVRLAARMREAEAAS
jgi:hypothetical protein